ncbi:MAG TPA: thioredoxin family protein [Thermoanaerobaculia bacterium]|nr:thioredoxin family protein [Thermoanaerobaculia bacterium]
MLRIGSALLAILLLGPQLTAEDQEWLKDWKAAFRIAKQERKLVFVDYYADWCAPCRMMEQEVFPTPDVQARLREYVLLRVDVDHLGPGIKLRPQKLPTYIIFDPGERDRFNFYGGMPAAAFLNRLDSIREGVPFMLKAADLFEQKADVEAWSEVAKGYVKVGAAEPARKAWQQVQRGAGAKRDRATAQVAEINAAFTWVLEGKGNKAVDLLKKIAQAPVNPETEGLCWFVLGQSYVRMKDVPHAREAFEKAGTSVSADHPLARQANVALADLNK